MAREMYLIPALHLFLCHKQSSIGDVKVIDTVLKWVEQGGQKKHYRIKVLLTNSSVSDLKVWGWLIFYDVEEFEIWRYPFFGLVKAEHNETLSLSGALGAENVEEVDSWQAVIEGVFLAERGRAKQGPVT